MASWLPQTEGYLPYYVLLLAVTSIGNALQCYLTMSYTTRLYPGTPAQGLIKDKTSSAATSPATPLSSRTFGTWTAAVAIVRFFAWNRLDDPAWYMLQTLAYVVALTHFGLEAFVYKTTPPSGPWLAPIIAGGLGLAWSIAQYDYYVK